MSERVIRERVISDDSLVNERHDSDRVVENHPQNVLSRLIWFIAGIIIALLAFRFLLALLGANTTNQFANFIYSASHPFVAPFFGLFNYNNIQYGVSRFEIYTLFAMIFYAIVAWGLSALVNINRR